MLCALDPAEEPDTAADLVVLAIPESPRGTPNLSPKPLPTISLTEPVVPGAVRADPGAAGHMLGFEVSRPSGITAWPPLGSFMRMPRQSGLIWTRLSGLAGSRPSDGRGRSRGMPVDPDEKERLLRLSRRSASSTTNPRIR